MIAGLKQWGDLFGLFCEVDPVAWWPGRLAGTGNEDERVAIGKLALLRPGCGRVADAAVHEHDPRPLPDHLDLRLLHALTITGEQSEPEMSRFRGEMAAFDCHKL